MDYLTIMRMGWNNEPLIEPCSVSDLLLWCRMRLLSVDYSQNRITGDMATELKEKYLSEYRENSTKWEMLNRCMIEQANRLKAMEAPVSRFRLSPSVELAKEIISIFYGLCSSSKQ